MPHGKEEATEQKLTPTEASSSAVCSEKPSIDSARPRPRGLRSPCYTGYILDPRKGARWFFRPCISSHIWRAALSRGHSASVIFLDSTAAYYRVARELAMGRLHDDEGVTYVLKAFDIPPEAMTELLDMVRSGA